MWIFCKAFLLVKIYGARRHSRNTTPSVTALQRPAQNLDPCVLGRIAVRHVVEKLQIKTAHIFPSPKFLQAP
jgi:hypothetical protein